MCNACGFHCCGFDSFDGCGCDCDSWMCRSTRCTGCGERVDLIDDDCACWEAEESGRAEVAADAAPSGSSGGGGRGCGVILDSASGPPVYCGWLPGMLCSHCKDSGAGADIREVSGLRGVEGVPALGLVEGFTPAPDHSVTVPTKRPAEPPHDGSSGGGR
jgi:hypothetical protein